MAVAYVQSKKTLIDFYLECGNSAHFIAFTALLYLWLLFLCGLCLAQNRPAVYFQLLLPSSLLPLVIGICTSSIHMYDYLGFVPSVNSEVVLRPAVIVLPLIAGSFLSALFLFLTTMVLFFQKRPNAQNFGPFEKE